MFNNKKIQLNNYIKLTDINFDLFIFSLQYESKKIKKLYDIYTKCDHSLIKNYEALSLLEESALISNIEDYCEYNDIVIPVEKNDISEATE